MVFMKRIFIMYIAIFLIACSCAYADTLILPSDIQIIDDEAFFGDEGLDQVVLKDGIKEIGSRAFVDSGLNFVYLPGSLESIAADAFNGPEAVAVAADKGTYAYDWAVTNGYITDTEAIMGVTAYPQWLRLGGTTTWTAYMADPSLVWQYAYTIYKGDEIVVSSNWSESNSIDFTPVEAGSYALILYARNDAGEAVTLKGDEVVVVDMNAVSESELFDTIKEEYEKIVDPWLDEEGYTLEEDIQIASGAFYEWTLMLKEQQIIEDCRYCEDGGTVSIPYNGGTIVYGLRIKDTYSGHKNTYSELATQSLTGGEYAKLLIQARIEGTYLGINHMGPIECANHIYSELSERYTSLTKLEDSSSTASALRSYLESPDTSRLRVVLWGGHGGLHTARDGNTYIIWALRQVYSDAAVSSGQDHTDWTEERIIRHSVPKVNEDVICVTGKFFDAYLPEVNGGLFISTACESFMGSGRGDNMHMARLVVDRGFDAYIGPNGDILLIYEDLFAGAIIEALCKKDGEGEYTDLEEALRTALNKAGGDDSPYRTRGTATSNNIWPSTLKKNKYTGKAFRLIPNMHNLIYDIRDSDGNCIEGAEVRMDLTSEPGHPASYSIIVGTATDGAWIDSIEIPEMDWGKYGICIEAEHFFQKTDSIDVTTKGEKDYPYVLRLNGKCTGTVTDQDTGEPLAGVEVKAVSSRNGESYSVTTNSSGQYSLSGLDCGGWTLRFSADGYDPAAGAITLSAQNWERTQSATLKRSVVRLDLYPYLRTNMVVAAQELGLSYKTPSDPDIGGWEDTYANDCFEVSVSNDSSYLEPTPIEIIYLLSDPEGLYCVDDFYLGMTKADGDSMHQQKNWHLQYTDSYNGELICSYDRGSYQLVLYYRNGAVTRINAYYNAWMDE